MGRRTHSAVPLHDVPRSIGCVIDARSAPAYVCARVRARPRRYRCLPTVASPIAWLSNAGSSLSVCTVQYIILYRAPSPSELLRARPNIPLASRVWGDWPSKGNVGRHANATTPRSYGVHTVSSMFVLSQRRDARWHRVAASFACERVRARPWAARRRRVPADRYVRGHVTHTKRFVASVSPDCTFVHW